MELQTLLECLTMNNNIHICVCDISGISLQPALKLCPEFSIHSKPFCQCVKGIWQFADLCYEGKRRSIDKAVNSKEQYIGKCHMGITEIVQPVFINNEAVAVVYIGNIVENIEEFRDNISDSLKKLQLATEPMQESLFDFYITTDLTFYKKIAKLVCDAVVLLYDKSFKNTDDYTHWAVEALKTQAIHQYNTEMTLHNLSKQFYFNEDYIGQLFKKHTGQTFSQYLNGIRLERAIELLLNTNYTITEISSMTGFNYVAYFNRIFKKNKGISPSKFKEVYKNENITGRIGKTH